MQLSVGITCSLHAGHYNLKSADLDYIKSAAVQAVLHETVLIANNRSVVTLSDGFDLSHMLSVLRAWNTYHPASIVQKNLEENRLARNLPTLQQIEAQRPAPHPSTTQAQSE